MKQIGEFVVWLIGFIIVGVVTFVIGSATLVSNKKRRKGTVKAKDANRKANIKRAARLGSVVDKLLKYKSKRAKMP